MTIAFKELEETVNLWGSSIWIDSTGLLDSFKQLLSLDFIFHVIHPIDW